MLGKRKFIKKLKKGEITLPPCRGVGKTFVQDIVSQYNWTMANICHYKSFSFFNKVKSIKNFIYLYIEKEMLEKKLYKMFIFQTKEN